MGSKKIFLLLIVFWNVLNFGSALCFNCTDYGYCMTSDADGNCTTCACPDGFSGECCDVEPISGCDLNPCNTSDSQHFDCADLAHGLRLCSCSEGWTGDNCDTEINGCDPNPCYNSNWCEQVDGSGFTCHCKNDYSGDLCETYNKCNDWWVNCGCDDDDDDQCSGHGTCIEKMSGNHDCLCDNQNYTGKDCEKEPCADNPCNHGGHCYTKKDGSRKCMCLSIWTGDYCDTFDKCNYDKCQNGGTCKMSGSEVSCQCVTGYEGPRCENITDNCDPNPCVYTNLGKTRRANCTNLIGDHICDCPEGTTGKNCEENFNDCKINDQNPCTTVDSQSNCTDGLNAYKCFCGPDYTGPNCTMSMIVWNVIDGFGGGQSIVDLLEEVVRQPSLIKDMLPFLLGQMSTAKQSSMSWDYDDLFVWAAYEKTELDIQNDIFKWFDTTLGNCFTFNHANSSKTYKLRIAGLEGGFRTLMRIRQDEYLQWYDTAALLIFLHPQDETVFSESLRYQVPPNESVQIVTNKVTFTRLGGKYGTCVHDKSEVTSYYYSGNYTTSGCLRACYQDAVEQACGCQDPRYAMGPEVPACGIDAWDCVNNVTTVKGDSSNWESCLCPSPCTESQYESDWSVTTFIETDIFCEQVKETKGPDAYKYCMDNYTDMAYVNIYVPRLTHKLFQETPKMTFNQFMSYIGGMAGMFIGFSIVTAIDLGFLIFLLIRAGCFKGGKNYRQRPTAAMLDAIFGRRKTPQELLRQNQRALNKAMRELDRERQRLEQQEKKIIADIKKMAKMGQMDSVRVMAKDLVRTRQYVKKFINMRANIQAVSLKVQTLKSQDAMAQAMKGVTRAMQSMNKQLNLPQIQKIMMEFEKQTEIMDMKEEMMGDAIDDAMGDGDDEEETEAVVAKVLDELGIQLSEELGGLPTTEGSLTPAQKKPQPVAADVPMSDADADLQARLEMLRKN